MATYERLARIRAPVREVWDFHSRATGLTRVTPDWLRLRIESIVGPDGAGLGVDDVLEPGTELTMSMRPFGLGWGPLSRDATRWTSRILDREHDRREGTAVFRDEMIDGPFDRWVHTHAFTADGDATIVRDRVEYELSVVGRVAVPGPIANLGFEPMFRDRHRTTKAVLESREVRG